MDVLDRSAEVSKTPASAERPFLLLDDPDPLESKESDDVRE
jgi:hypothetical protein